MVPDDCAHPIRSFSKPRFAPVCWTLVSMVSAAAQQASMSGLIGLMKSFVLASRADLVNAVEDVWSELEQEVDAMQEDAEVCELA